MHVRRAQSRGGRSAVATRPHGHTTDAESHCGFCVKVVTRGRDARGARGEKGVAAGHTRVHVLRGLRRPDQAPGRWLRGSPFLTAGPAPAREQWASASAGFGDGVPWPPQRPHTQLGHSGFASPGCVFQPSDPRRGQRREGGPAPGGAVASPPRCPPAPSPIRGTRTVAGEAWRDLSGCVCAGPSVSGKYRPTRPAHATPRHATSGKHGGRALTLLGRASRPSGTPRCAVPGGRTPSLRSSDGTERSSGLGAGDRGHGHRVTWRLDTEVIRFRGRAS